VIEAHPLLLVHNGSLVVPNLDKELLTQEEVLAKLRGQGIENLEEVKAAYLESDGTVSVIKRR
jgi:uncharacterized membrane protein YcaP (DUF421 family)